MASRPKLIDSKEITETKVTNQKTVLGSSSGENVFCTLETNDGRT
jgi:hypothetical protein